MFPDLLMRDSVRSLVRPLYPSARPEGLRLDGNTNLLGPNPVAREICEWLAGAELNHYPTPNNDALRAALAEKHGLGPEQFLVGNGSDEVIDLILKTFLDAGETAVSVDPSFVMYPFYTRVNLGKYRSSPFRPDGSWPIDALLNRSPKVIFIASPNNPTGDVLSPEDLARLSDGVRNDGIVVIDEAYVEFSEASLEQAALSMENVILLRTFSKAQGLAGIRVGYAYGAPDLIRAVYAAKAPYNLNLISEMIAIRALADTRFVDQTVEVIRSERGRLSKELEARGYEVHPSQANFLLVKPPSDALETVEGLSRRQIYVRPISNREGAVTRYRITIGPAEMMDALLAALDELSTS